MAVVAVQKAASARAGSPETFRSSPQGRPRIVHVRRRHTVGRLIGLAALFLSPRYAGAALGPALAAYVMAIYKAAQVKRPRHNG